MRLRDAIHQYIAWRRDHGAKYESSATILYLFLKSVKGGIDCDAVATDRVLAFLAGKGALTRYRENKHGALAGFYRYAISRGYATRSPLPDNEPRPPASASPHIYSCDELRRLFNAVGDSRQRGFQLDADTFRTLLFLLYGAGLRVGEARRLTLADVDLHEAVLTIRDTKFFKSRLVPIGTQLSAMLKIYASLRESRPFLQGKNSFFLANRDGTQLYHRTIIAAFAKLLHAADVHSASGERPSPRLHDFRHSFAVHRLTEWYRQDADVQRLLPLLSTYLGHADMEGTKVYLSMTPELLQQASTRFERYANGGNHA
jgi:site-specific recombinase XerD